MCGMPHRFCMCDLEKLRLIIGTEHYSCTVITTTASTITSSSMQDFFESKVPLGQNDMM